MPQRRISHDVIPGRDTRDRRVHDHKAFDLVRVARRIGVGDHDADIVGDHGCTVVPERRDDRPDVRGLRLLVVTCRRARRVSDAAKVRHDDGVGLDKLGRERSPGIARFGVAVEKDDDGSGTAGSDKNVRALRAGDCLRPKRRGQGRLRRGCVCEQ